MCKFHDPSIIGSRDTEGGGGSEEPLPSHRLTKKPSLNRVNTVIISYCNSQYFNTNAKEIRREGISLSNPTLNVKIVGA